jgi:hypothetical protein
LLFDEIILVVINDLIVVVVVVEPANSDDLVVDLDVELKIVIRLELLDLIFISEQPNK